MASRDNALTSEENALVLAAKISLTKAIKTGGTRIPAKIAQKLAERPRAAEEVSSWLRDILNSFSVNEYTVAAKLAEGLEAKKHVVVNDQLYEVPDYFTQHKYLDTAAKLLNIYPPSRQQLQTDGSGIVVRLTPAFGYAAIAEEQVDAIDQDNDTGD